MNRSILATAIVSAIVLTACGGGGGGGGANVRPDAPPPPPPPPQVCEDESALNHGGDLPCEYRYSSDADNTLVPINADVAHEAGFTGKGVKIGLLDDPQYPDYAPLDGQVAFYKDYTDHAGEPEPESNGKRGHGTMMAATIAGMPVGDFKGGVAPDAKLYWGRICYADNCWSDDAATAVTEMLDKGVRIFNLSIGSYQETVEDEKSSAAAWGNTFAPAVAADSLIVLAVGNDGKETAGYPAASPHHDASLADNWLAVAALEVDSEGNADTLADYSNWCGDAANWCLAAPGLHRLPALEGTDFQNGSQGSSNAAAAVTGVAALVQQAFPWMGGHNLQQTLLTTATDLGDAGVDAKFGWGLVNAEKAIKGPGKFVMDFNADVTGTSTFSNDISGNGGLVKGGRGTLVLAGNNTFKGEVVINRGVLGLSGDIASSVAVNNGGVFAAMGGTIGGDYTDSIGATTQIEIGNPLMIDGTANLSGSLMLMPVADDYAVEGIQNLITAASVNGNFTQTVYSENFFWNADLSYTGTTVDAELTRMSGAAAAAESGASMSVVDGASQVDSLVRVLDGRVVAGETAGIADVLSSTASVINASGARADAALTSLTGQIHGTQRSLGVQGALNNARAMADRLPHLAATDQLTSWVQVSHFDGNLERTGYANAEYRQNSATFGVDLPVGDASIGFALTKGELRSDIADSASHLESDRIGGTFYTVKPIGSAYVSGVLGFGDVDVATRRSVITGTTVEQVKADRDESIWTARIEAGLNLDNGLSPFVAAGTIVHQQDAFSEHGSTLGLSADDDTLIASFADAGLRHRRTSGAWTFDSLLAYRTLIDSKDTDFRAWFTALPDATFTVNGQALPDDAVRAMFGVGYRISPNVSAYGNATLERAGSDANNASATLGLRWVF